MAFTDEVTSFLSSKRVTPNLTPDQAKEIGQQISNSFGISLDPIFHYNPDAKHVDAGIWNQELSTLKDLAESTLPSRLFFLFIRAHPKCVLISVTKSELISLIFDQNFYFDFVVSAEDFGYLLQEDSGIICATGIFESLLKSLKEN